MTENSQTLSEFTTNLISDLESGAISPHEALSASQQYGYLREELATRSEELDDALLLGGDAFTEALLAALSNIRTKLDGLPSFQSQQPDRPIDEKEIRDVSALRAYAIDRVKKDSQAKLSGFTQKRRVFVHNLVNKFSSTIPSVDEKTVETALSQSLVSASKDASSPSSERFSEFFIISLESSGITASSAQISQLKTAIASTVNENSDYISSAIEQDRRDAAIYTALFDNIDCSRPDVLVDVALHSPATEPIQSVILRANKLAGVAQALEESGGKKKGGTLQFFSSDGTKGIISGLQKGADGILSLVGEPIRDMVLHEKVNGTLKSMFTRQQQFVDRLGENFVRSAIFTHIAQDLTKQLGERQKVSSQARTVFGDLVSSIFRGPLDPVLQRSVQNRILDYFELARANAAAPKGRSFLALGFIPGHAPLSSGVPGRTSLTPGVVPGRAPLTPGILPWDLFRVFDHPSKTAGTDYRPESKLPLWFPWLGLRSLGNFLTDAFSSTVDKTTSFFFTNPFLPRQLQASRRAAAIPTPITQDMPLMVAIIVIVVIVLLFIFPSPINLSQLSHSSKVSALLSALYNNIGEGLEICPDCVWPTNGNIFQGPHVTCNPNTSHYLSPSNQNVENAIDINESDGNPVYAVSAGDAYEVVNSFAQNQGDSWGNYVKIRVDEGGYTLIYAHLSPEDLISEGHVEKGQRIGYVDNTGYSTGAHLHFGVYGSSPDINTLLPFNVGPCVSDFAGCECNYPPITITGN